ncbi:MAG: hypothetical protein V3U27_14060, partial [Candidatus Tectomicrobia bacterium]
MPWSLPRRDFHASGLTSAGVPADRVSKRGFADPSAPGETVMAPATLPAASVLPDPAILTGQLAP